MNDAAFFRKVASQLGCDVVRAEEVTFAIFQELRDRLTPKEAADVAAQLPRTLRTLWEEGDRPDRAVAPTQAAEFLAHVRTRTGLGDGGTAEQAVKVVFGALQEVLGDPRGLQGESWDVFSQLPKSLKRLWLEAGERKVGRTMDLLIGRETLERIRRELLDRQRALFDDVDGLEADLRVIEEGREAELETRGQGEAMARLLDRVRERDRHGLEEIHRALAKIPAGTYGTCESCGRPIAVERLLATPETRRCLDCERTLETAPAVPPPSFERSSHRPIPPEYRDLDDGELAEAVRERIRAHGDPDLAGVHVRCQGGVVRLSGEIPSDPQRQVLVQIVADGLGLEVLDRVRVMTLDREDAGEAGPEEGPPSLDEERIPRGRGMQPLASERWSVPEDEGEAPETAPDSPIPEKD